MTQPWQDPNSPEGQRWHEDRQQQWSGMWAMFQPPGGKRRNWFYVDIPTLLLSIVVGYPLGLIVAASVLGESGAGGIVGIFAMMMVFGFLRRQIQLAGTRGTREAAVPHTVRSPRRTIALHTIVGGVLFGLLGLWFALSEGDIDLLTAAVRFGAIGAVPGFLTGIVSSWRARG